MAYLQNMSGPVSTGRIIKTTVFSQINRDYNVTSGTVVTTGNGIDITVGPETTILWLFATGTSMAYDPDGVSAAGSYRFYYHSSDTQTGATPSGAGIGVARHMGAWNTTGSTARHDFYGMWTLHDKISVSASTNYKIQLCAYRSGTAYYLNINGTTMGYAMESK